MYKFITIRELYLAYLIYFDILVLFKIFKIIELILFPTLQIKNYTSVLSKLSITEKDRKLLKYRLSQRNDLVIKNIDQNKSSIGFNIKHNSVAPTHIFLIINMKIICRIKRMGKTVYNRMRL